MKPEQAIQISKKVISNIKIELPIHLTNIDIRIGQYANLGRSFITQHCVPPMAELLAEHYEKEGYFVDIINLNDSQQELYISWAERKKKRIGFQA